MSPAPSLVSWASSGQEQRSHLCCGLFLEVHLPVSHHYGLTTSNEIPLPGHLGYLGNLSGAASPWEIPKVTWQKDLGNVPL